MDIVEEFVTCEICFEIYDGNIRCPRVFECGHTFCSHCILHLMKHNTVCPNCKYVIKREKLEAISINYSLKQLAHRYSCRNVFVHSEKTTGDGNGSESETPEGALLIEGFCDKHHIPNHFRCMRCSSWLCGNCAIINHKYCRILKIKDFFERVKAEKNMEIQMYIELALKSEEDIMFLLRHYRSNLDEKTEIESYHKKRQRIKKNCQLNHIIRKTINMRVSLSNTRVRFRKLQIALNSASCEKHFDEIKEQFSDNVNDLQKIIDIIEANKTYLLQQEIDLIISNERNLLAAVATNKRLVFASKDNELTRWGSFDVHDGKLRIHCVQKEPPPSSYVCLTIEQCLTAMTGCSEWPMKIFFQFGFNDTVLGEVTIRLNEAAKQASKTILQACLFGNKGTSFKGVEMDWNEATFIHPICFLPVPREIDYQTLIKEEKEKEWKEGDVVMKIRNRNDGMQFRFRIWVKGMNLENELIPAGVVIKGFEVCKEVLQWIDRNEKVKIIDSGWICEKK